MVGLSVLLLWSVRAHSFRDDRVHVEGDVTQFLSLIIFTEK